MSYTFQSNPFRIFLLSYKYLGLYPPTNSSILYYIYSFVLHTFVTIYYPVSMIIDLLRYANLKNFFQTVSLPVALTACMTSMKTLNVLYTVKKLRLINELLAELDERIATWNDSNEIAYLRRTARMANRMFIGYSIAYGLAAMSGLPPIFSSERKLIFSAWSPLDWENSFLAYVIMMVYQLLGAWMLIYLTLLNNTCPGLYLLILKGHFSALNLRVSRIGFDAEKSRDENYEDLIRAVEDHKRILKYRQVFEEMIGSVFFVQLLASQVVICIAAVKLHNIYDMEEYFLCCTHFACALTEILLLCYCADEIVQANEDFRTALYSCKWMDQDRKFKRTLIIVMQRTQKPMEIYAGGIVKISLTTLMAVLRSAYSLFAILDQMR